MKVLSTGWMTEDDYSEALLTIHTLEPKLQIVTTLFENLNSVRQDPNYMKERLGDLSDARRKQHSVVLAMQILALTIELIDDFAAYCFAFYRAKKEKSKHVAEFLRDWGTNDQSTTGNPKKFFESADNIVFVAEISGLDPITNWRDAADLKARLRLLKEFRDYYEGWYQGYKHGQRAIPVSFTIYRENPKSEEVVWGVFMIPDKLTKYPEATGDGSKIYVDMDVSFLSIIDKVAEAYQKAQEAYQLWQTVRGRVHQACFGNSS